MPIYEYECSTCGSTFELMQSISAKPPKKCETEGCKGKPKRLVSASGFILKGSGWYTSDYPSEARKQGWEQESKHANPGKADAAPAAKESTTETAPAAKAPAAPAKESKPVTKANAKSPYKGSKKKSKASSKSS